MRRLAIAAGALVGVMGVLLLATGYFAVIGLLFAAGAVALLTFGFSQPPQLVEQLDVASTPSKPLLVSVAGPHGYCPAFYHLGDTWEISDTGKVTPPLCQPAIDALNAILEGRPGAGDKPVYCRCPLGGDPVAFAAAIAKAKTDNARELSPVGERSAA